MQTKRRISWILAAAVSCGIFAGSALAQQRVGSDGRALDANNRVGSGGVNEGGQRMPSHVMGNQIVTGNVTGGREFRGTVNYTDPFAFRGQTAGITSDRFIRSSAGVPIQGVTGNNNAGVIQPFYGESRTVERPPGFQLEAPGTGFVPAPMLSRQPGDLRLGRPYDWQVVQMPQPGQLILPGPVDPNTQQATVITASPLYGVRMWNFDEEADQQFLQGLNEVGQQRSRLDERSLQRMRQELIDSAEDDPSLTPEERDPSERAPAGAFNLRLDSPFDAPQNEALGGRGPQDRTTGRPLGSGMETDQRAGQRVTTAPERQSEQYAELRRRLQRFSRLPESSADLEAHRRYNEQVRAQREREEAGDTPGVADPTRAPRPQPQPQVQPSPSPTAQPGLPGQPPAPQPSGDPSLTDFGMPDFAQRSRDILQGAKPDTPRDAGAAPGMPQDPALAQQSPLVITSLATGVQARGLSELLKEAETMMQDGKFYTALDQYDLAEQVAPNNPMVPLGRSIAELGAGYYNRADQHIRQAFSSDPALMMGQYDLRRFLGTDRLEYVWNDLKSISSTEEKEPRSVFLLAFIAYNTGDARRAAAYLDLAERRSSNDPFFAKVREHWNLPAGQPDSNK